MLHDPDGTVREFNGHEPSTTNNRMELTAAIEGLRATPPESHVLLRSDSQYVVKTVTDGWKRNANKDLWPLLEADRARVDQQATGPSLNSYRTCRQH